MKLQIIRKKFFNPKSLESFKQKAIPKERIHQEYQYQDTANNRTVYVIEYYRNTKRNRNIYGFEDPELNI